MSTNELRDVPAPAKINLFLHVVGQRSDGYHLLQTVFRFIDLNDTLHFRRRDDGLIRRVSGFTGVSEEECLTVRAARLLQEATGCRYGVDIELEKCIPAGGGLGGGSSDAATVLLALNRLWQTGLSRDKLMQLGVRLGADVPVFVFGRNAFAEGIGERLRPVKLRPRWYVIIQPDAHVSTAEVFSQPDLTRNTEPVKMALFTDDEGYAKTFGCNDLQAVVCRRYDQVALVEQVAQRIAANAKAPLARMSGSGACFFIECTSRQQAAFVQLEISATIRHSTVAAKAIRSVHTCQGLDQHPLQQWAE